MAENTSEFQKMCDGLRQNVISVENRCFNAAEQAQMRAVEKATASLDDLAKALKQDVEQSQKDFVRADDMVKTDVLRQLSSESARLKSEIEKMGAQCNSSLEAAIALSTAQFRETVAANQK